MIPVTMEQLTTAVDGEILIKNDKTIKNVIIDSREQTEAALFVPVVGEKTDGHRYVAGAVKNGAVALFMQKESPYREEILTIAKETDTAVIAVTDTVMALQQFAAWYRRQFPVPVVGITGSVGKTTTKEMISAALETEKKVLKTIGNKNSQIGLPLMMFYLDASYDIAVIEMGMSEVGEMKKLAKVAKPECAVMTNIGVAHIAQLGSKENIRKEKLNIVNQFGDNSVLFVNGNDLLLNETATQITQKAVTIACDKETYPVLKQTRVMTYGIGEAFDVSASQLKTCEQGIEFQVTLLQNGKKMSIPVHLNVFGTHNVMNALAAIVVAMHYGIAPETAICGLEAYEPIAMRGQIRKENGITWIDDTYNASPDSMKSGIQVLLSLEGKRHIAVFADVLELGAASEQLHREVGAYLAEWEEQQKKTEILLAIGTQAAFLADEAKKKGMKEVYRCASNEEAVKLLRNMLQAEDVVLVKGSRGMHTEEIVQAFLPKKE